MLAFLYVFFTYHVYILLLFFYKDGYKYFFAFYTKLCYNFVRHINAFVFISGVIKLQFNNSFVFIILVLYFISFCLSIFLENYFYLCIFLFCTSLFSKSLYRFLYFYFFNMSFNFLNLLYIPFTMSVTIDKIIFFFSSLQI